MLSISDLDPTQIEQAEEQLVQMLMDEYPSMDLSRGRVLRDLVIRSAAIMTVQNQMDMDSLRRSFSLQQIASDPSLANDDIVDGVLSNLLLSRDVGAEAVGQIRVILSLKAMTPIDAGAVFEASGLQFTTLRAFTGVTASTNVVNTESRLITSRSDGLFEFLIDVEAAAAGTQYNVAAGTRFTTTTTIPRLVDLVAAVDFSGGRVAEDNAALVARAQNGLSPRVLSGRSHIEALLRSQFPAIQGLSIIGFGDPEMRRDAHNLFQTGAGGKVDIYVRSDSAPSRNILAVTATRVTEDGQFSASIGRDAAAGVYDIVGVYQKDVTPYQADGESEPSLIDSLPIVTKAWSFDPSSDDEFVPDMRSAAEAAFTRYRTLVLTFTDSSSDVAVGGTAEYQVYALQMPQIAEIQDFVNERSRRGPAADYLVRAPVPALCALGIRIYARNVDEIDADAVKQAVATRVNALNFSIGYLPASVVIDAVQGSIAQDAVIDLPISMLATLYLPDGTTRIITASDELTVPDVGDPLVSSRTVGFFVRIGDIDVNVLQMTTPEV